ncbi:hypothetical protein [Paraburkholderia sp.]|uniref:hypothetical protein n=1 Tax=Paraburkholderia sp. TaxID=1926495 RepID=UPI003D6DC3FF
MGPVALFDKSFLQSLTVDESVWFDHFFYPNICPLFYVETLADLTKATSSSGRTSEQLVRMIADKTPGLTGVPCAHHRELCVSNLMGMRLPMSGRIPLAGGRAVRSADGKAGVVFEPAPEAQAFSRWQRGEFKEVEHLFARGWRDMLSTLDLPRTAERMRKVGIDSKDCKSVEDAHQIAMDLVRSKTQSFEQMALLFAFVDIPRELHHPILQRWAIELYRPLYEYAPYAAHVLAVELFFQICMAASLISAERASNRVDIGYLLYLPFCMIFVSSDKLHKRCSVPFLRSDQSFVWGQDLKKELGRLNGHFASFPQEELERGIMRFAPSPVGSDDALIIRLWDKHAPGWRESQQWKAESSPEGDRKIVESLRNFTDAPTVESGSESPEFVDPDHVAVERIVKKRKGSWWVLPKDLKTDDEEPDSQ